MAKTPAQLPSVEDLIEAADAGRFDDRLDGDLPDEFFTSRGKAGVSPKRTAPAHRPVNFANASGAGQAREVSGAGMSR